MLPKDRRRVGERAEKSLVPCAQRPVAKLHSLIKYAVEFLHISARREADVNEIYRNYALIESAVVLRFSLLVNVRRQEGTAAHTGIAMTVAVCVYLVLKHYLL